VFDKRMSMDFTADAEVIGHCVVCDTATKRMENCNDPSCRELFVVCEEHAGSVSCEAHQPMHHY
jgi:UPF0176 protein